MKPLAITEPLLQTDIGLLQLYQLVMQMVLGASMANKRSCNLSRAKEAPIIGNVCMDMMMIDITGIDCKEGDEVIVFGKESSAEQFASQVGTISYELLTAISQRVKRVLVEH